MLKMKNAIPGNQGMAFLILKLSSYFQKLVSGILFPVFLNVHIQKSEIWAFNVQPGQ